MLIEERKRIISIRPINLFVSVVCLLGLSVTATFLIVHARYQNQLDNENQEIMTVQKNSKATADMNIELRNSLQKLENEHSKLESQYDEVLSKLGSTEEENVQAATELATTLKDLEESKAYIFKLTDELDAKLSKIEALNVDLQTLKQKYQDFEDMLAPYLVLEPTWVSPSETTPAFNGNLLIVLYESTEKEKCPKDSVAFSYLISGTTKNKLCLRARIAERFKYQGKNYLLTLLKSEESEGNQHYCIYIMKER